MKGTQIYINTLPTLDFVFLRKVKKSVDVGYIFSSYKWFHYVNLM